MILIASIIHCIFAVIFFLFQRYIEMGVIVLIWVLFISKIIPPLDIIRRPKFLKQKVSENVLFEQSLYFSSGILFYTALVGVALGIANVFGLPVDLNLLYYCIFFLTSVICGIYLLTYPKNPNTFVLLRTHTMVASGIMTICVITSVFFGLNEMNILMIINLFLLITGLGAVIILDRKISLPVHVLSVYFFLISILFCVLGVVSFFDTTIALSLFFILGTLVSLYIFFPTLLDRTYKSHHIPLISWHFSNCILGVSWAIFWYIFWSLFWWPEREVPIILLDLFFLFWLWFWVYATEAENPLFFSGMVLAVSTTVAYGVFMVLPPIFWIIAAFLFVFAGGLVLLSRIFKNRPEELILAGWSVLFLCASDIVLIFQSNNLLSLALLFLFQSLIWYVAYEIFHRQTNVKNRAL
jgi:hypothetical protein